MTRSSLCRLRLEGIGRGVQQTNELRGVEKKSGESFSTFSASVPRPGISYRNHRKTKENQAFSVITRLRYLNRDKTSEQWQS